MYSIDSESVLSEIKYPNEGDSSIAATSKEYKDVGFMGQSYIPVLLRSNILSDEFRRVHSTDYDYLFIDILNTDFATNPDPIKSTFIKSDDVGKAIYCKEGSTDNICYMFTIKEQKHVQLFAIKYTPSLNTLTILEFKRTTGVPDPYLVFVDFAIKGDDVFFAYQMTQIGFKNSYGLQYQDVGENEALASIITSTRSTDCSSVVGFSEVDMSNGVYTGPETISEHFLSNPLLMGTITTQD